MRNCILFNLLLLTSISCRSDDLDPPTWRGTQGSSFQQWDFLFVSPSANKQTSLNCSSPEVNKTPWGHRGPPDKVNNPFQEQSGICVEFKTMSTIMDKIDWLEEYNDRHGVWRLKIDPTSFNSLDFIIPNNSSLKKQTMETQVQLSYEDVNLHPTVKILMLLPGLGEGYIFLQSTNEYQSGILPGGWLQRTFRFETDFCPKFENVRIFPPEHGEIHIDKVIVDVICRESEDNSGE